MFGICSTSERVGLSLIVAGAVKASDLCASLEMV
jgi:hypothetical protein